MAQSKLTRKEIAEYRDVLQGLIGRLTGEVSQLRAVTKGSADQSTPTASTDLDRQGDPGAQEQEQALAITLLGTEEQVLGEARAALVRLDRGTFGLCEGCSQPISRARLKALPYTRYCIDCARANESRKPI